MPKIVHLSSVHRTNDTRIYHKECRSLAAAGFNVTLIAQGDINATKDGVKITPLRKRSGNRFLRMTLTGLEVLRKAVAERGDAYHFHDPELIPAGLVLKALGKRVIYDSHENVPKQIRSKYWIPEPLRGPISTLVSWVSKWSGRVFDGVVIAEPGIAVVFPGSTVVLVQNFVMPEEFESVDLSDYHDRQNNVAYVGSIMKIRGAVEMVKAMALLPEEFSATLLLGGGFLPIGLHGELVELNGWKRVNYLGWLDRPDVVNTLQNSRVGLLPLHPVPKNRDSQPVKIFEYMLAGLPIVSSNIPYYERFIVDNNCGIMVDPKKPSEIATAIAWLLDNPQHALEMGARGRQAALEKYTWDNEAVTLVRFYRELLSDKLQMHEATRIRTR